MGRLEVGRREVSQMADKKPEWFELADNDASSAQVTKVNKKIPAITLLLSGLVIATGAFFASASESDAEAEGLTAQTEVAAVAATDNGATNNSTVDTTSTPATHSKVVATAPATQSVSTTQNAPAAPAAPAGVKNPAVGGVPLPSGRGDDDDDREGGEHHERGEHEGGEHHEGRDDD